MHSSIDDRQRVLDATDIVRLIGEHLSLKPKGREYVALCPFHDDHSPSMYVAPAKQIYKCFSCGAGGNAIDFVVNYHKMSFREALGHLAEKAGVTLAPTRPAQVWESDAAQDGDRAVQTRAALLSANATAAAFYRTILAHAEHGRRARQVLSDRGVAPEMIELFQLGSAPDRWDGLALTISSKGLEPGAFRAAGLVKAREAGQSGSSGSGSYDAFRNRLIFPIHDQIGRIIGFGARRLNDEDEPKYLNSPESPVFDKSATLYALHQAAQAIRTSRTAIVAEGYMDAIACHQGGIRNVVATLGTALTHANARTLRRLADTVVLLFDGDEAGQRAAERAVEVFFAEPIDVRIATLSSATDAKDPDELLRREGGAETLREVIRKATDPLSLLFARVSASLEGQGLSARSRSVTEFVARLVELGLDRVDKVRYQLIVKRLAEITGVEWSAIASEIDQRRLRRRVRIEPPAASLASDLPSVLAPNEHLLACIMCAPELALALDEADWALIEPSAYAPGLMRQIAHAVASVIVSEREPSARNVLAALEEEPARRTAAHMIATTDRLTGNDAKAVKDLWRSRLLDARLEASRRAAPVASMPNATPADIARNIAARQASRAPFRRDPLAVPRPTA